MGELIFADADLFSTTGATLAAAGALVLTGHSQWPRMMAKVLSGLGRLFLPDPPAARSHAPTAPSDIAERQRIISDLHDGALQLLASGLISLRTAERQLNEIIEEGQESPARRSLVDGIHLVQAAVCEIRSVLFPSGAGSSVSPKLAAQVQRVMQRFEPAVPSAVHVSPLPDLSSMPAVEQALAGIIGEALGNALKHARPCNVWVEVSVAGDVVIGVIRDDGVGFDVRQVTTQTPLEKNLGLLLIQERARCTGGHVRIMSQPGAGTIVEARLPFRPPIHMSQSKGTWNEHNRIA